MSFTNYMFKKIIPNDTPIKVIIITVDCNDAIFNTLSELGCRMYSFLNNIKSENDIILDLYRKNALSKRELSLDYIFDMEDNYQLFLNSFDIVDATKLVEINTKMYVPENIFYLTELAKSKESFAIYFNKDKFKNSILSFDDFCNEFNKVCSYMKNKKIISNEEEDELKEIYDSINDFQKNTYQILKTDIKEIYIAKSHLKLLLQNYYDEINKYRNYLEDLK